VAGYVIANVEAFVSQTYPNRRDEAAASIERFGGRYLVRGGAAELREGDWSLGRLIVLEFESLEQARLWYDSTEYAALKAERSANARSQVILVEGVRPQDTRP
jgi:uncharacterized protein (DUF1330 family)